MFYFHSEISPYFSIRLHCLLTRSSILTFRGCSFSSSCKSSSKKYRFNFYFIYLRHCRQMLLCRTLSKRFQVQNQNFCFVFKPICHSHCFNIIMCPLRLFTIISLTPISYCLFFIFLIMTCNTDSAIYQAYFANHYMLAFKNIGIHKKIPR